ncbi:sulfite exporter TauE/SafE family protein [Azospirillum agricola]|uniref:sulfite exporter TauE/SafE family protein n=1 Tax=Azospirillum agricola TaxID=1720247 RepID=UPI000A0F23AE|nr:sulfite exporter TauE/SafE family protein [Azospirillum agricola]SMH40379.1 Sulfite exporter TauE/SafE [Azospirillum lipoferum]
MPSHSLPIIAAVALTFLLAGGVKGMIGLGLPTVAMGLLGLVMPPAEAASLLIVPSLVTNVWQLASGPRFGPLLERLWPMMAGVCLGTWVGAGFLASDASGVATMALGIALVLYAILGLSGALRVPAGSERWMGPLVGLATGLVTAATGVFVIPAVPYLQALALEREELVQALGLSFTVSTVALAAGLAQHGVFRRRAGGDVPAGPASVPGRHAARPMAAPSRASGHLPALLLPGPAGAGRPSRPAAPVLSGPAASRAARRAAAEETVSCVSPGVRTAGGPVYFSEIS